MSSHSKVGLGFAAAVVAIIALVLALDGSGSARVSKLPTTPCACAGYVWHGRVQSVSGDWTVPEVQTHAVGLAATWIGAEIGGRPGRFIQVGVQEGVVVDARGDKFFSWYAFWSDTDHDYRIQPLGLVQPGDPVHATLSQSAGQWTVQLEDPQSSLDVHFSTRQEAGPPVDQAEWFQEDTQTTTGRLYPYPHLSTVRFRGLRVDGATPENGTLVPRFLTDPPNLALIPSPVIDNSFTIGTG
jgi:hypothetical protein